MTTPMLDKYDPAAIEADWYARWEREGLFEAEPDSAGAPFVISGSYFGRRPYHERFERDGLAITFDGWCCALEDYASAFEAAGLLIEALREPLPAAGHDRRRRLPMFLHLRARKPQPAA